MLLFLFFDCSESPNSVRKKKCCMQLGEVFMQDNYLEVLEWLRALVLAQCEII